jgi:hypothetical protein
MAGALGLLMGAGLGVARGYAQEKVQQKHQQAATWADFLHNAAINSPGIVNTPEFQKEAKTMYGEHAPMVLGILQAKDQAQQQAAQEMKMAENTKFPDTPEAIQSEMSLIRNAMTNQSLPLQYHEAAKQHLGALQKEHDRLQTEAFQTKQKLTETPYQKAEEERGKETLKLSQQREKREAAEAADREEARKFNQTLAQAKLGLGGHLGGKGITAEKLAAQRQKFDQQFAQYRTSDPERAVAIDQAWNEYLDRLKDTGTDPKLLEKFYTGGATTESAGGVGGLLGKKTAVEKPAFKAGDRREKDGVTYERDEKGNWTPVK